MRQRRKHLMAIIFILTFMFAFHAGTGKANAAVMALKASKTKTYTAKANSTYYASFKASKTGYVRIYATNTKYITLVDASHKKIASCQEGTVEDAYKNGGKSTGYCPYAVYGVKKGKQYYVKLTSCFSDRASVKYTITGNKVYAANKKNKAYTLKKGKTLKTAVIAGKKKTYWFKYKSTASYRSLLIDFETSHFVEQLYNTKADPSYYTVQVYDSKGNLIDEQQTKYNTYLYDYHYFGPAAPKGTVLYIKVVCENKYTSGWFSLKVTQAAD